MKDLCELFLCEMSLGSYVHIMLSSVLHCFCMTTILPYCGRPKVISLPKFGYKRHHDFYPNLLFSIESVSLRKLETLSLDLSLKKPYKRNISSPKYSLPMSRLRSSLQTCQAFGWLQLGTTLWMSACDFLTDPWMRMSQLNLLYFWDCEIHAYCCIPLSMRAICCIAIGNKDMGGSIFLYAHLYLT